MFCYLVMPESPKWEYTKLRFQNVRDTIEYIKRLNGEKFSKMQVDGFLFDTERELKARGGNFFVVYQRDHNGLNAREEDDVNEALVRYRAPPPPS